MCLLFDYLMKLFKLFINISLFWFLDSKNGLSRGTGVGGRIRGLPKFNPCNAGASNSSSVLQKFLFLCNHGALVARAMAR